MRKIIRNIVIYVTCIMIMVFVNYLYDRSLEPCIYTIQICTFLMACVTIYDIWKERMTVKSLEECKKNLHEIPPCLSSINEKTDELYQEIIQELYKEYLSLQSKYQQQEQDATDYYTMWIHQIKTPIAAMQLLIQSGHLEKSKNQLQQELFRVEQYAEMAMHYLHITSDEEDLQLKDCEISIVVKSTLKKFAVSFIEKHLQIQFEDFSYHTVTDEKWFSFLVEQIISNSVKYTSQGGVKIYFENAQDPMLIIEDSGIGIRQEDIPRIFEKGFTGYNGHVDKRATGIGLYLCQMIGNKLGIKIEVTSQLGVGTRVALRFIQEQIEKRD